SAVHAAPVTPTLGMIQRNHPSRLLLIPERPRLAQSCLVRMFPADDGTTEAGTTYAHRTCRARCAGVTGVLSSHANRCDGHAAWRLLPIACRGGLRPRSAGARVCLGAPVDSNHRLDRQLAQATGAPAGRSGAAEPPEHRGAVVTVAALA